MPVQVIDTKNEPELDHIAFETSAVYEMLVSITTLIAPHRFNEWTNMAIEVFGKSFYNQLLETFSPYMEGTVFVEFGTGWADQQDVPGFINFVRAMTPEEFTFYMLGRAYTREQIAATGLKPEAVREMIKTAPEHLSFITRPPMDWLSDIAGLQHTVCNLWAHYWESFFAGQIEPLRPHWMSGLRAKEQVYERDGVFGLMEHITGFPKNHLPSHPPGDVITQMHFVPIYFTTQRIFIFYGYGSMTVLFDSQLNASLVEQITQARNAALRTLKALSDENRIKILRLIVLSSGGMNGKKLAEHLNLSPSAVSRHLSQLKDGNLVTEHSEDNRTITYTLNRNAITSLPDAILDYLYS